MQYRRQKDSVIMSANDSQESCMVDQCQNIDKAKYVFGEEASGPLSHVTKENDKS